jgi:phosphate transport system permease protein
MKILGAIEGSLRWVLPWAKVENTRLLGTDRHWQDRFFFGLTNLAGLGVLAVTGLLLYELVTLSWDALRVFGVGFYFSADWNPYTESFGALAFIYGTLVSSALALLIATPISVGVALLLTEILSQRVSRVLGFLVEMLAAIPSVVYGLWGIFVLAPFMRTEVQPLLGKYFDWMPLFQGPPFGVGMLTAGIVLAMMITPTICSICREIFLTVPRVQRESALALGATRWESISVAVLKGTKVAVMGAIVLGLGRALGETMAVTMVIGNRNDISTSLFAPAQTMASLIANEYNEATGELHLSALAAVGLGLFVVSLVTNTIARSFAWRVRQREKGI